MRWIAVAGACIAAGLILAFRGPPWRTGGAVLAGIGAAGLVIAAVDAMRRARRLASALAGATAAAEDATRLVDRLRAAEPNVRAVFEAVDLPVIAADASGRVVICNRAAAEFIGLPGASPVGKTIADLFTHADLLDLWAAALAGRARARQVRMARPNGPRIFEASAAPIGPGAPGAVMTLRDVTELARAVQVKTDFVANASHELRTPIAALRMAVETLQGAARDDPEMAERLVRVIAGHVLRLEEMTHDLLDLSRLESPELRVAVAPVPASQLAAELRALFADACARRGLRLEFDLDPALERMRTDRGLLMLILKNLVDNAVKFAYEGTAVRVVGRAIPNGIWQGAGFEVIDQGQGIPLAQQDRIFERFYQLDEARSGSAPASSRGTGLGLAIVKHAVRTLGGQVSVRSVWKQGTTMTVELPSCLPPDGDGGAPPQRTLR